VYELDIVGSFFRPGREMILLVAAFGFDWFKEESPSTEPAQSDRRAISE